MFLVRWILSALALYLVAEVVPGIEIAGTWSILVTVIILGLINALIRPVLLILTLPINIITLGLFTLVINALMFWLTSTIVKGFDVAGFGPAFFGALIYMLIHLIINSVLNKE